MSRGKVRRPVHNVEAHAKRRRTSLRCIAIDISEVGQGPALRRRIKSQQQPLEVQCWYGFGQRGTLHSNDSLPGLPLDGDGGGGDGDGGGGDDDGSDADGVRVNF